ncbi:MAG: hypothetical protein M0Z41_16155 [Peptococcaceae bacterium]|jgi:hypothetical protein|nr:hypothetical protein [Peptococcaceae bacterium]
MPTCQLTAIDVKTRAVATALRVAIFKKLRPDILWPDLDTANAIHGEVTQVLQEHLDHLLNPTVLDTLAEEAVARIRAAGPAEDGSGGAEVLER